MAYHNHPAGFAVLSGWTRLDRIRHAGIPGWSRSRGIGLARASPFRLRTSVILNWILAAITLVSLLLLLWQWEVARRFPLHRRSAEHRLGAWKSPQANSPTPEDLQPSESPALTPVPLPAVTLLKPLKGCDAATETCLRSWLTQDYPAPIQVLFGVAANDPVCGIVRRLLAEFPELDIALVVCGPLTGANAKVSKLAELEILAKHEVLVISDADVRVPPDFLANAIAPLFSNPAATNFSPRTSAANGVSADSRRRLPEIGLVTCFYRLAKPTTLAMQWEAIAINADFWSQVLQSRSLKPLDFALGAVMVTRRKHLADIGGFIALADCLADDYQLGNRLARHGYRIGLCPVVVECWDPPMTWRAVWHHQLRWARTIRVCQPMPYFLSILSNVTLWALLWFLVGLSLLTIYHSNVPAGAHDGAGILRIQLPLGLLAAPVCVMIRILSAGDLQRRITGSSAHWKYFWLVPIKDLLQAAIWVGAFLGNRIAWRGQRFRLRRDGTLEALGCRND
jgi:ceramide glucosyltransferase